jgi:hypothetical protein
MYRVISCGVNAPPNSKKLNFAEKDAADVSNFFTSALGPIKGDGVATLLGDQATSSDIYSAFIAADVAAPDYLVFYFSGHGNDEGIATADGLMGYDHLAALVKLIDAPYVFVILDVCSAASAATFFKEARVGGLGGVRESWLAALAQAKRGTRLIFSTNAKETAIDSAILQNGVFTHYFLQALRRSSGDFPFGGRSWISDRRASISAANRMKRAGYTQLPVFHGLTGDFPLAASQADEAVGSANFIKTVVSPHSLDISLETDSREKVRTILKWSLYNGQGELLDSGTKSATPGSEYSTHSGSIPFPHQIARADRHTKLRLMTEGAAPISWELELLDETGNLLDYSHVRATFRAPRSFPFGPQR